MDVGEYDRWQQASAEAVRGADLQAGAGLHHWAAFQYEQAAQLALKGLLHGLGRGPDAWGHDVSRLGDAVSRALAEPLGNRLAASLKRLARHYIPARYPDAVPGEAPSAYYSEEDAEAARADAAAARAAVAEWWAGLLRAQEEGPPEAPAEEAERER